MFDLPDPPIPRSYWVTPMLLGGVHPGGATETEAELKLDALIGSGVTHFVDLTEEGELEPYHHLLQPVADVVGLPRPRWTRVPVPDVGVPSEQQVGEALEIIDEESEAGGLVYLHCWDGKGRTGAVVGCHLARDLGGEDALAELNDIRRPQVSFPEDLQEIPETDEQRGLVLHWSGG